MNHYGMKPYDPRSQSFPNPYLETGKIGAVVGLCGAGAVNLGRVRRDEVGQAEAVVDTLRVGFVSGLATATATLVANQFRSPALSLLATLVTGTAVMYVLSEEPRKDSSGEVQ